MRSLHLRKIAVGFVLISLAVGVGAGVAFSNSEPALRAGDPLPENLFVELAKTVNPAVVSVSVSFRTRGSGNYQDPMMEFLEQFMGQPMRPPHPQEAQAAGTGFVIEADGLAVTNNHVIDGADNIKVTFLNHTDKTFDATVIGRDPRTDIALIKIKGAGKLPTVKLGSSKDVQIGQWVAAFGNPYGYGFTITKGIISAIGRQIRELNAIPFIQTDASINPGNSGGPLVNTKGEVIGVNSAIDARAQGIGFAIPIDYVKQLIPELKEKGRISRGYIGVGLAELNPKAKQALGLPVEHGAIVMNVVEESPAQKAGIEPYDVIVQVGDRKIEDVQDLMDAVALTKIGTPVKVTYYREGKKSSADVTVGEPPQNVALHKQKRMRPNEDKATASDLGFVVVNYSNQVAKQFGLPPENPKKPIIVEVEPDSPAAQAGIRPGDMVLDVNRRKVNSASDVTGFLKSGSNIIRVQNGKQISLVFINVR